MPDFTQAADAKQFRVAARACPCAARAWVASPSQGEGEGEDLKWRLIAQAAILSEADELKFDHGVTMKRDPRSFPAL